MLIIHKLALMHSEQFGNLVNYDYGEFAIPFQEDMSFRFKRNEACCDGIPDTRNALIYGSIRSTYNRY